MLQRKYVGQIWLATGVEQTAKLEYCEGVDSAPSSSAGIEISTNSKGSQDTALNVNAIQDPESYASDTLAVIIDHLWQESEAELVDLQKSEFALLLKAIGAKYNYGLAPGVRATREQIGSFWRVIHLKDLALAQACALGRDAAWQLFLTRYREQLRQAAIAITNSASLGEDLADSIYSEMFGLSSRNGVRRSPLASYAGRGSLMGFLRTALAQRHVDYHRSTHRETPLEGKDFAMAAPSEAPTTEMLGRVGEELTLILRALGAWKE